MWELVLGMVTSLAQGYIAHKGKNWDGSPDLCDSEDHNSASGLSFVISLRPKFCQDYKLTTV